MKTKVLQLCAVTCFFLLSVNVPAQYWRLSGNAATTSANFLGTTDNQPIQFKTNNILRMVIKNMGAVGIGTSYTPGKFNIDGGSYLSLTSPGYEVIGKVSGYNLAFDPYNIQSRNDSGVLSININPFGGSVYLGNSAYSYYGAVGFGSSYGLYGSSSSGTGVYGVSNTGSGVVGYASTSGGNNSRGLNGFGNYGVYATTYNNDLYYAGYFAGDVVTSGVYSTSDEKLKQNIKEVTSAISIINQLHPKTYQFRQDGDYKLMNLPHGQHYGLIAQEVEKVLPNLVKNSKFDAGNAAQNNKPIADARHPEAETAATKNGGAIDYKALNYTELIPILVKGMQEQQQTIQSLQQTVAQQQQQIDQLLSANPSSVKTTAITNGALLQQNAPNPFSSNTVIRCTVPPTAKGAQLQVYNSSGSLLKTYTLENKGINEITISGGTLSSGQYSYALVIDGKTADSKNMILTK